MAHCTARQAGIAAHTRAPSRLHSFMYHTLIYVSFTQTKHRHDRQTRQTDRDPTKPPQTGRLIGCGLHQSQHQRTSGVVARGPGPPLGWAPRGFDGRAVIISSLSCAPAMAAQGCVQWPRLWRGQCARAVVMGAAAAPALPAPALPPGQEGGRGSCQWHPHHGRGRPRVRAPQQGSGHCNQSNRQAEQHSGLFSCIITNVSSFFSLRS